MAYVLGVDSSTTATKAILVDETGTVVGVAASEYPFETPHPLWSEQDPDLWWTATYAGEFYPAAGLGWADDDFDSNW